MFLNSVLRFVSGGLAGYSLCILIMLISSAAVEVLRKPGEDVETNMVPKVLMLTVACAILYTLIPFIQ
ncbi:hypothetical protein [Ralstonia phage RSP15]|uniref:hypothetical protein n=1 Tax=Ralstonia phage RSP15 TaxID=1785960 RepID=UPI00074D40B7|nr:hypothetical protein BH754_gp158 [Ralstonia phage RSP15]BAU40148.1 hypothetical protein [Ralstonia phage RSP15]